MNRTRSQLTVAAAALAAMGLTGSLGGAPIQRTTDDPRARHHTKRGPGRRHMQGKGHKYVPAAHPDHATDCELNDHPSTEPKACNCFRRVDRIDGMVRRFTDFNRSMRRHYPAVEVV